jgi:hypothetical protein
MVPNVAEELFASVLSVEVRIWVMTKETANCLEPEHDNFKFHAVEVSCFNFTHRVLIVF